MTIRLVIHCSYVSRIVWLHASASSDTLKSRRRHKRHKKQVRRTTISRFLTQDGHLNKIAQSSFSLPYLYC